MEIYHEIANSLTVGAVVLQKVPRKVPKLWPSTVWRQWSKTPSILVGEMWTCLLALLVNEASKCDWALSAAPWEWLHSWRGHGGADVGLGQRYFMLVAPSKVWAGNIGCPVQWDSRYVAYKLLQGLASYFSPSSVLGKKEDFSRLCPAFPLPCWNNFGIVPNSRCEFHILQYICMQALALSWMASVF